MDYFEIVGKRLNEWAARVRSARGDVIADITTATIKDLCGDICFDFPKKFKSYIDDYKKRESTLQFIADYRDHFVHPFHVFVLGYYILGQWRGGDIMPLDLIGKKDENLNLKTWFIASIYHDVGYPAEKLEVLVRTFFKTSIGREMSSQFDWSSVLLANDNIDHIDRLSECFAKKASSKSKAKNFEKWIHKRLLEEHDHGALTALMLCSQGWDDNDLDQMVYEAALAIALHSWKRSPNKQLEFDLNPLLVEKFPLAFYLRYCDSAQEWGRKVLLERMKIERVPFDIGRVESKLDDILVNLSETKVETKVILEYWARKEDPIVGNKTLKEVFDEVGNEFESTWYLKERSTNKFMIEGKDKHGIAIGGFGPRPQRPT